MPHFTQENNPSQHHLSDEVRVQIRPLRAARRLFENERTPANRYEEEIAANLVNEEIDRSMEAAKEKWNFDFVNGVPLQGDWVWEPISGLLENREKIHDETSSLCTQASNNEQEDISNDMDNEADVQNEIDGQNLNPESPGCAEMDRNANKNSVD